MNAVGGFGDRFGVIRDAFDVANDVQNDREGLIVFFAERQTVDFEQIAAQTILVLIDFLSILRTVL